MLGVYMVVMVKYVYTFPSLDTRFEHIPELKGPKREVMNEDAIKVIINIDKRIMAGFYLVVQTLQRFLKYTKPLVLPVDVIQKKRKSK